MEDKINIISVGLQHKEYPNALPIRHISYMGGYVSLSEKQYTKILEELPEKWSNDNEKIVRFSASTTNESEKVKYYLELQKRVFDFRLREYVQKYYIKESPLEDYEFLFNFFKEKYIEFQIETTENFYEDILSTVDSIPVTSLKIKQLRDAMLRNSDVYMIPDYPISEEEREEWKKYRQELRDITDQESWPNDISNIQIPVAPNPNTQVELLKRMINVSPEIYNEFGVEFIESKTKEFVRNFISISTKLELVNSIAKLNIPIFVKHGLSAEEIASNMNEMRTLVSFIENKKEIEEDSLKNLSLEFSKFDQVMDQLNDKISDIDGKLKQYNLDFTITDILNDLISQRELQEEVDQIMEGL